MLNLTDDHCAKTLLRWGEHYVKRAEDDLARASARRTEEAVQLRVAKAVEEERQRADPYYGVGFGAPTAEQQHEEILKRASLDETEASRVLLNNQTMLLYIKRVTQLS